MKSFQLQIILGAAALTVLITGCATPYQSVRYTGGYDDIQLDERKYEVTFRGNGYTSASAVRKYLLLRCAELTLHNGYSHFVVLDGRSQSSTSVAKIGNDQVYVSPNGYGGATATVYEAARIPVTKHSGRALIYMLNEAEMNDELKISSVNARIYANNYGSSTSAFHQPPRQRSNTKGFFLNAHLNGTGVVPTDIEGEVESGAGGGLKLGYGVSRLFTVYVGADGAIIDMADGVALEQSYSFAHVDLGGQFNFRSGRHAFVPYLDMAVSGRGAAVETGDGTLTISGVGFSFGGGFKYFFNRPLSLDLGVGWTVGKFSEAEFRGQRVNFDLDAMSARFNLGLSWYPNR